MNKHKKLLVFLIIVFFLVSCQKKTENQISIENRALLGSVLSIKVFENIDKKILNQIFDKVQEFEETLSISTKDYSSTEVLEINNASNQLLPDESKDYEISLDLLNILKVGLDVAQKTDGAFDPSVAPLVSLWGWGSGEERIPSQQEIEEYLPRVGWSRLSLNEEHSSLNMYGGQNIDVGGIGKGYAADVAKDYLIKAGVKRAIIDFGGNILLLGEKESGAKWRIGIQKPFAADGEVVLIVDSTAISMVTSGIYERYFEEGGVLYSHLIDPKTGKSVENNLLSVSILSEKSVVGDAFSTALFVLGLEKGLEKAEETEEIEAIFITKDKEIYYSSGISEQDLEVVDDEFVLK